MGPVLRIPFLWESLQIEQSKIWGLVSNTRDFSFSGGNNGYFALSTAGTLGKQSSHPGEQNQK